jgi:HD-GYP domain-containing protein (c-di-GMP phosphodiesterase class II)
VEDLKELRHVQALDASGALELLRQSVAAFVARSGTIDGSAGFLTERQAGDDLIGHTLGVVAITNRIGAAVGFAEADLHAAALAAALHDIGMLMVPEEIRRTPQAQRTAAQRRRYEDHTVLGEAVLRPLARRSPALSIVALEHHEDQAGGGYPLGITGGNRVLRAAPQGPDAPRRLALVSEVVAVADRYERLVSPQPGVAALSPATARRVVANEAGARLNAEVVGRFLDLVPPLPLGTEVCVTGGEYDGARGVVVKLDPAHLDRPVVRLFAARHGATFTPVDLTMAAEPASVTLAIADETRAA